MAALFALLVLVSAEYLDDEMLQESIYDDSANWYRPNPANAYWDGPELLHDNDIGFNDDTDYAVFATDNAAWVAYDFKTPLCVSDLYFHGKIDFEGNDAYQCTSFLIETAPSRRGPWTQASPTLPCGDNGTDHVLAQAITVHYMRLRFCACQNCVASCAATSGGTAKKRQATGQAIGVAAQEFRMAGYEGTCEGVPTPAPTLPPSSVPAAEIQAMIKKTSNNFAASSEQVAIEQLTDWEIESVPDDNTNQLVKTAGVDKSMWFVLDLGGCRRIETIGVYGDRDHDVDNGDSHICFEYTVTGGETIDGPWTPLADGNCHRDWLLPDTVTLEADVAVRFLNLTACGCRGCGTRENELECRKPGDTAKVVKGAEVGEFKFSGPVVADAACAAYFATTTTTTTATTSSSSSGPTTTTSGGAQKGGGAGASSDDGMSLTLLLLIIGAVVFVCLVVTGGVLAMLFSKSRGSSAASQRSYELASHRGGASQRSGRSARVGGGGLRGSYGSRPKTPVSRSRAGTQGYNW